MKKAIRAAAYAYIVISAAPVVIKGGLVLLEAFANGIDNSLELLRVSLESKNSKEEEA